MNWRQAGAATKMPSDPGRMAGFGVANQPWRPRGRVAHRPGVGVVLAVPVSAAAAGWQHHGRAPSVHLGSVRVVRQHLADDEGGAGVEDLPAAPGRAWYRVRPSEALRRRMASGWRWTPSLASVASAAVIWSASPDSRDGQRCPNELTGSSFVSSRCRSG